MDRVAPWAADYVGIPFTEKGYSRNGLNCFGLMRLVLWEQAGVKLPEHADRYEDTRDRDHVQRLLAEGRVVGWRTIAERVGSELVRHELEQPLDCLLLRIVGRDCHVGVVVGARHMLHIEQGKNACIEKYQPSLRWERHIAGIYRYERAR